jgi:hypothetical protein
MESHDRTLVGREEARRVDMSRELRRVLFAIRTARLNEAGLEDPAGISTELVFASPDGESSIPITSIIDTSSRS